MRKDLSPCSLCGGYPLIKSKDPVHRSAYRFKCNGCGLSVEKGFSTREEAAEAWEAVSAPKARTIDTYVVPCGYTLIPAELFKRLCEYVRQNNFTLYKCLAQYNIWHYNVPLEPPPINMQDSV
jgi:hypothetical protein